MQYAHNRQNSVARRPSFIPFRGSGIRETLIKIMMSPHLHDQRRPREEDYLAGERLDANGFHGRGDLNRASVGRHLSVDPLRCMFWCAIAIGALSKGRPVESVSG